MNFHKKTKNVTATFIYMMIFYNSQLRISLITVNHIWHSTAI
jgi:hypothetical protein